MGSGKTLLADVVAMIATGRRAVIMAHSPQPEEERKRLLSVLLDGAPLVVVDNIGATWTSDALSAVLTAETFKDRVLGANRMVEAPTAVTWLATGNNLTFAGDLATRVLVARIEPQCERPEERRFERDLYDWIPRHRGIPVAAALTILRAYQESGRPDMKVKPYGRFEDWSSWIRSALVWLGEADPCDTRGSIEDADPVRSQLRDLLGAWHERYGTSAETIARAIDGGGDPLRAAMYAIAGERNDINTRKLGRWMLRHKGRIVDGKSFGQHRSGHAARWAVVVTQKEGSGYCSKCGYPHRVDQNCQNNTDSVDNKETDNSGGVSGANRKHTSNRRPETRQPGSGDHLVRCADCSRYRWAERCGAGLYSGDPLKPRDCPEFEVRSGT